MATPLMISIWRKEIGRSNWLCDDDITPHFSHVENQHRQTTSVGWRNLNSSNSCSPGETLATIQSSNKSLQTPGPLYAPLCVLTFHLDKIYTLQGLIKTCLPGFHLSFLYDSTWVPLLLLSCFWLHVTAEGDIVISHAQHWLLSKKG